MLGNRRRTTGFTLVELLIVMGIIAMLAILGGANYITSLKRARDAARKSDLEQVRAALEMHRTDNTSYPNNPDCDPADAATYYQNSLLPTISPYLKKPLVDPLSGGAYAYCTASGTYEVCANLEVSSSDTCNLIGSATDYDYGVISP